MNLIAVEFLTLICIKAPLYFRYYCTINSGERINLLYNELRVEVIPPHRTVVNNSPCSGQDKIFKKDRCVSDSIVSVSWGNHSKYCPSILGLVFPSGHWGTIFHPLLGITSVCVLFRRNVLGEAADQQAQRPSNSSVLEELPSTRAYERPERHLPGLLFTTFSYPADPLCNSHQFGYFLRDDSDQIYDPQQAPYQLQE